MLFLERDGSKSGTSHDGGMLVRLEHFDGPSQQSLRLGSGKNRFACKSAACGT